MEDGLNSPSLCQVHETPGGISQPCRRTSQLRPYPFPGKIPTVKARIKYTKAIPQPLRSLGIVSNIGVSGLIRLALSICNKKKRDP